MRGSRARPDEAVLAALADLGPGEGAVLALSGGPDSTALLALVARLRPDLRLVAVHVRHRLRDDVPDAVAALRACRALGVPCRVVAVAVPHGGEGVAGEARRARYGALLREAAREGADALLVAHTAEDQAETVLLALARGSGTRGLGGMRADRLAGSVRLVRPLLAVRRADLRDLTLPTASDPGNLDERRRRTLVRTRVLPALEHVSGDAVGLLGRAASLLRDDADLLDGLLEGLVLPRYGHVVCLPRALVEGAPAALAGRLVRLALVTVRGGASGLGEAAVRRALALPPGRETEAGGVRVTADGAWLACAPAEGGGLPARPLVRRVPVDVPELGAGARLRFAGEVPDGALVRACQPGDRRPAGELVARALLDAGVPRAVRPFVPLVAHGATVLWTPLDAGAPAVRATGLTPPVRADAEPAAARLRAAVVDRFAGLLA